ncbi:MAG: Nitronate monooxygenase [Promethearchaeota archaeon]|jgi:NAD(P)H-dependent flavin oxidoreductase YrpB (nitropropane dioxygenase family)|nr:MAG: Nitronate monooxygenase [Candidatus Lokiarchaeota archaeon]
MIETEITKMFDIKYPIISAPMGPFYTTKLTVAVSEAGGLGVLSHTNLLGKSSEKELKKNMEYVVEHTDKPFGFNIRTSRMQPDAPHLCRVIPKFIINNPKIREQCKYIITSAGSPKMLQSSRSYQKLKEQTDVQNFHVAPALWLADKCVKAGVDGLVCTGTEGGGHQSYEKVSTLVLLQQFADKYPEIPIVACGGFATGRSLAGALVMGADAVAMGSRFIASKESEFHQNYKDIVPEAKAIDTELVTGVFGPIRLWKNKYSESHGLVSDKDEKMSQEQQMTPEMLMEDQKHYEMTYEGDIENGAVLLGQSIGIIDEVSSVGSIMENVIAEAKEILKKAPNYLKETSVKTIKV